MLFFNIFFMQVKCNYFVRKPAERVAFRNSIIASRIGFLTKMSFSLVHLRCSTFGAIFDILNMYFHITFLDLLYK